MIYTRASLVERLWRQIVRDPATGCWDWQGRDRVGNGYGRISVGHGRRVLAHRAMYELVVEPIPVGMTLDHLCRRPGCVNPSHMEVVTVRENVLRSDGPAAQNARKTECHRGHPFTPANTITRADGRECRACAAERDRARRTPRSRLP